MRHNILTLPFLILFVCLSLNCSGLQAANTSYEEAESIAVEAYIYGYPLVAVYRTMQVMTNVVEPEALRAPLGQFVHARGYPHASFQDFTAPNADTFYSFAWLDLSKEPYIFHIPDLNGRYYLMPIFDAWTNVIASPGTRTLGAKSGDFAIVGPRWKGIMPPGMTVYKSPTNLVIILGRTYCDGSAQDYKAVHEIQDHYSLVPLSAYGKEGYHPPKGKEDPAIDMKTAVIDQVNAMDGVTFFKTLAALMKWNPPVDADADMIGKLAKIGIIPGNDLDLFELDLTIIKALQAAPKLALPKIRDHHSIGGQMQNGWLINKKNGTYGTDYLQRAYVASVNMGANLTSDSCYYVARVDGNGKTLSGMNKYVLRFPKGQTPPVRGFWSLTMYNNEFFFFDNPLNKYTLSLRDPLKYNEDGSLDLYLQHINPGTSKESNWLPSPKGEFILMLRLYWPKQSVLQGVWKPPAIEKVSS